MSTERSLDVKFGQLALKLGSSLDSEPMWALHSLVLYNLKSYTAQIKL